MIYYESEGNRVLKIEKEAARVIMLNRITTNKVLKINGFNLNEPYNERMDDEFFYYEQPIPLSFQGKTIIV